MYYIVTLRTTLMLVLQEYDHPHLLLDNAAGVLTAMVQQVGQTGRDALHSIASKVCFLLLSNRLLAKAALHTFLLLLRIRRTKRRSHPSTAA